MKDWRIEEVAVQPASLDGTLSVWDTEIENASYFLNCKI